MEQKIDNFIVALIHYLSRFGPRKFMLSYTYYKYNLKPTYTISIYYKNERGQIPEKGFSLIEKLYYNVFEIMSSFDQ